MAHLLVVILLAAGFATPAGLLLGAPLVSGQAQPVEFTLFEPSPLVLPPSGGTLTVDLEAKSSAEILQVVVEAVPPGGGVPRTSDPTELVRTSTGRVGGDIELTLGDSGPHGWWRVRIVSTAVVEGNETRPVTHGGVTSALFLLHGPSPVAGVAEAPWSQSGGTGAHVGRTVAVGPEDVDVVRWDHVSTDRTPFHEPVVAPDGTVYAVSWGGEVHALSPDGEAQWSSPFRLGSTVVHPPALLSDDRLVVATRAGALHAVTPDGARAWSLQLDGGEETGRPISPPVVASDGTINLLTEPWTLVRVSPGGQRLSSQPLDVPVGLQTRYGPTPEPVQGPPLALTTDNTPVVAVAGGLAVVEETGTTIVACNCTPASVAVVPGTGVALVGAADAVIAVSLDEGRVLWSTEESPGTELEGIPWSPAAVGWGRGGENEPVYIVSEDGDLHKVLLHTGTHVWTRPFFQPLRSQPVVDGEGNVYFADGCRTVRSLTPNALPRWTFELDSAGCQGLSQGLVVTRGGSLLWVGPDGALRMLGTNRPPVATFTADRTGDGFRFDASGSSDPDGSPLSYAWDFGDGTTARGVRVDHRYQSSGSYAAKLTVSDGSSSTSASQDVVVNFPPEPVVVEGVRDGQLVLNASSTTDPEDDALSFNWTLDGEPAGTGPLLSFPSNGSRVYQAQLRVDDGYQTVRHVHTALSPARGTWTSITLALYDGSCPAGTCAFPSSLEITEGRLVEALVVNGGTRPVTIDTPLAPVDGGTDQLTLAPGEQGTLHLHSGRPGTSAIDVGPAGPGPTTQVPVRVNPAPATLSWQLVAPDGPVHVDQQAIYTIELEGPAPPQTVDLQLTLRNGVEELTSRRVTLVAGQPVEASIPLAYTPRSTGEAVVEGFVRSLDTGAATAQAATDAPTTHALTVHPPTLASRIQSALPGTGTLALAVLALLVAVGGGAGAYLYTRRRAAGGTVFQTAPAATGTNGAPPHDATVAGSFMPRKVERFEIERVLGEGGFGTTYLATDTVLERRVVLKELEHVGSGSARDLLLHEARTAANLSHSNVVTVHDVVEEEGRLLLVMEHVDGGTLADRLKQGPVRKKEALSLFADVLQGLSALHEAGIVHRDLKPSNILITEDGVAKITDFGVAAKLGEGGDPTGEVFVGTPRYMAPEQLTGEASGPAADLYAAGALLYEMLTGEHHLGLSPGEVPPIETLLALRSNLPAEVPSRAMNDVLATALTRDPAKRFPSALAFLKALRTAYRAQATEKA